MSDIGSSVGGRGGRGPEDRMHDPLYQEQLQRAREEAHGEEVLHNPSSKLFHYATALLCLKKFIGDFTERSKARASTINKQKAIEDLTAFKAVLEELANIDKSHDPDFTQRMSLLWQNLYENCIGVDPKAIEGDKLAMQILNFVNEIKDFPPGEDFTLGYYLSEHAGQDWIPFPFMSLLFQLHEAYSVNPDSQLAHWIYALSEIIGSEE